MSVAKRIIPKLDIKGPNLVKGIHLEGLRVLGKPEQFARYYYETGADELLLYMDCVASLYGRNSLYDIITKTAKEVFIPLIVSGGLRTLDDIRDVLRAGADKVCINTAAVKNPEFIKSSSKKFGSSTVLIAIEAIKQPDGKYLAFTDNGREFTGLEVLEWAKQVEELGAGEIMITSIDREGTGHGFDVQLTSMVSNAVSIPVIACGGAGRVEDVAKVIDGGSADATAIASILHYDFIKNNSTIIDTDGEGNTEFLRKKIDFSKIESADLHKIKEHLRKVNINCRQK